MEIEQLMKQLAQGGITVQGDFVMEKKVEYEVNNVEQGGIGIQVVNGKLTDKVGDEHPDGAASDGAVADQGEAHGNDSKASRQHYLFVEGDSSWKEQGKRRNPYRENEPVRRRERDRLLRYLSLHKMGSRSLTTQQGDTLNSIVASFLVVWRRNGWIAKDFSGRAAWRFLHDDCGIVSETTQQSYANKIKEWVNGKKYSIETLADVEDFVRKS